MAPLPTGMIHVICNPEAGQGRARRLLPLIERYFAGKGEVVWQLTRAPGDAEQMSLSARANKTSMVIAVGGDGTVNEVVNGLMAAGAWAEAPPLAVIPAGSSNSFSTSLNVHDVMAAFRVVAASCRRHVDVGRVTVAGAGPRYFCVSAGFGFLAAVAHERRNVRWGQGRLLYFLASLRVLAKRLTVLPVTLEFDTIRQEQHRIVTLSINNCASVGGYLLTPEAEVSDGRLHLLTVGDTSRARLVYLILLAGRAGHLAQKEIIVDRFQALSVNSTVPLPLHLDGEIHDEVTGAFNLKIDVCPKALCVIA